MPVARVVAVVRLLDKYLIDFQRRSHRARAPPPFPLLMVMKVKRTGFIWHPPHHLRPLQRVENTTVPAASSWIARLPLTCAFVEQPIRCYKSWILWVTVSKAEPSIPKTCSTPSPNNLPAICVLYCCAKRGLLVCFVVPVPRFRDCFRLFRIETANSTIKHRASQARLAVA